MTDFPSPGEARRRRIRCRECPWCGGRVDNRTTKKGRQVPPRNEWEHDACAARATRELIADLESAIYGCSMSGPNPGRHIAGPNQE